MTRIRRIAVLLSATAAVLFGAVLPADARFAETVVAGSVTIGSVDVLAPGSVVPSNPWCKAVGSDNSARTTAGVDLAWTASPSRGVSGYQISAHFSGGPTVEMGRVSAGTTTFSGQYTADGLAGTVAFSVTTLTSYGWTEKSAQTADIRC
jgi:hypothetical protein